MKSTERHKLKENEFARTVGQARELVQTRGGEVARIVAVVIVLLLVAGGVAWWWSARDSRADALLASALATYEMPVVPPQPPAPGSPPPLPQPGSFQSQQERLDASLPKFLEAANSHPNREAGITARFHVAGILSALGRHAEAEQRYREVIDKAGDTIYGRTGRMGLAEALIAQNKHDEAIATYTELSRDTASTLPLDGVLMHLGRAYLQAGRKEEAVRTFSRVFTEFPQSAYAAEARQQAEASKKS